MHRPVGESRWVTQSALAIPFAQSKNVFDEPLCVELHDDSQSGEKPDLVVLIAEEVAGNPPGSWRFLDMMKSLLNLFDGFRLGWLI